MDNKVILLVEDNADDEALTMRALKKYHMSTEVVVARDGVQAIDYILGIGEYIGRDVNVLPQVVLLDLKLPKVDGLEVLRRIRGDDRTKLLPVVILTSSKAEEDLVTGYGLGANSYVRKPVDSEAFAEVIRGLGLFWITINQSPLVKRA